MLRRLRIEGTLAAFCLSGALLLASCTIGPVRISIPRRATPPPPLIALRWCEQARDVLCILSFGLEPPDRMVIVLLAAPGMPTDLEARALWNGMSGSYPCDPALTEATVLSCIGPLIALGSSVHLEVVSASDKSVLASGDLALKGIALPTVQVGAQPSPTGAVNITPLHTQTRTFGTPYPNPTSKSLPKFAPTATRGAGPSPSPKPPGH